MEQRGRSIAGRPFFLFTKALYDEATKRGWIVVSMKDDWKKLFAFE